VVVPPPPLDELVDEAPLVEVLDALELDPLVDVLDVLELEVLVLELLVLDVEPPPLPVPVDDETADEPQWTVPIAHADTRNGRKAEQKRRMRASKQETRRARSWSEVSMATGASNVT